MKKILLINLLLLNTINTNAEVIEIPEKTTLSQDDFYLKGKVKTMNLFNYSESSTNLKNKIKIIINFHENRLVKKIDSSEGVLGQEFFYEKNFPKIVQHDVFYTSNEQRKTNHLIGFVKDYTNNYPSTILYSPPNKKNIVAIQKKISYQDNLEIIESYSQNLPFEFTLRSKVSNLYDPQTHKLISSTKAFPDFFKRGVFDQIKINYNAYGISSIVSKFSTTQYHYKDKELSEITSSNESSLALLYSDYQYDLCGNWIKRKIIDKNNKQVTLENREFEYYSGC
ncbi:hypothetical protein [Acinetobacter kyonggiensis]|uniref:YD repeat-containing protein n=1 Tax=Acinetobacter kyonggiensis TaxID=595670 RepID=A0A1H3I2I6_9GAMM|nr:hypothetical protein [Acinetobacter kyonggiensis]SDY21645.1 hypothetical protein SAMN05421643_105170 [Acinetobacter kyonggiensis]